MSAIWLKCNQLKNRDLQKCKSYLLSEQFNLNKHLVCMVSIGVFYS